MRLAGISTIEAANAFAQGDYIPWHNELFAEEAAQTGNAHRPVVGLDLHNIFAKKSILPKRFYIFQKTTAQLKKHQRAVIRPKEHIIVHERLDR